MIDLGRHPREHAVSPQRGLAAAVMRHASDPVVARQPLDDKPPAVDELNPLQAGAGLARMRQRLAPDNPASPPRRRHGRVVWKLLQLAAVRPCAVRLVTDDPALADLQKLPLALEDPARSPLELDRQAGRKRRHVPASEHAGARPPSTQLLSDRFRSDDPCPTAGHAPVKQRVRPVQTQERLEVSRLECRRQNLIDPHVHTCSHPRGEPISGLRMLGPAPEYPDVSNTYARARARARAGTHPLAIVTVMGPGLRGSLRGR